MTQSQTTYSSARPVRHGFTLIELLVVLGVMAILMGVLLVAVGRTRAHARAARALADMQSVATVLEAYHSDTGTYPPSSGGGYSGAEILAWALIAPYSADTSVNPHDGKDGPGFRIPRAGVVTRGSVFGPYLDPEKFLLPIGSSYVIKETYGFPLLYFRRVANPADNAALTLYVPDDNAAVTIPETQPLNRVSATAAARFNAIATREAVTGPYLLWSAGVDAAYGPQDPADPGQVNTCDDILLSGGK